MKKQLCTLLLLFAPTLFWTNDSEARAAELNRINPIGVYSESQGNNDFIKDIIQKAYVRSNIYNRVLGTAEKNITYKTNDFYNDSNRVLLARMLLGEAENCSDIEKISIAYTALNRINDGKDWNGTTLQEVILSPKQYSCFNANKNIKLKNPLAYNKKEFKTCLQLAEEILSGRYADPTNGATHYLNPNHPDLNGKSLPSWTKKMIKIGRIHGSRHIFYKES